jgi:DNA invertase Pin-like site-specific DNA recombinase
MSTAAYVRVSTTEQATEGFSLDEQTRRIEAYAAGQDWMVDRLYMDAGVSGSVAFAARPQGAEAFARAAEHDRLVVTKLDRLGRSAPDLLSVIEHFTSAGCDVVSVSESLDTSTSHGRLLRTVLAGVAEFEHDRISERVAEVERAKAQAGRPHGGPAPYGYRYAGNRGGLTVEPGEAAVVKRIFAAFSSGQSMTAIARSLHQDGIPTRKGRYWRTSTVRGILGNPVYVGRIRHKGETFPARHQSLVDPDTYDRVMSLLADTPRRARGRPPKGDHLFRGGMLRCAECGEAMVPRTRDDWSYYYCNGHSKLGSSFCTMQSVGRAAVDSAVYAYFEQVGLDAEATRTAVSGERERELAEIRDLRAAAIKQERQAEDRLARVRRDYLDGRLSVEDWQVFREELGAEGDAARSETQRLSLQLDATKSWSRFAAAEEEAVEILTTIRRAIAGDIRSASSVDAARAAIRRLFDRFELHSGPPKQVHVELALSTDLWIHPIPQERVVSDYTDSMRPILRREALVQAGKKLRVGLPCLYTSGPE